jgi:hypothetical protein
MNATRARVVVLMPSSIRPPRPDPASLEEFAASSRVVAVALAQTMHDVRWQLGRA